MSTESDQVRTANDKLQADANAALSTKGFGAAVTAWISTQDPATTPVPTPTPGTYDPHTAWLGKPWTSDATTATVDANSAKLISTWQAHGHIRYPNVCTNSYSSAWAVGTTADKAYDIPVTKYGKRTLSGVHVPAGTKPSPDSDAHLTIFDVAKNTIFEMWQAAYVNNAWTCSSCADYPLNVIDPGKSGTASSIPAWAIAIWPEEIQAGRIKHAVGFSTVSAAAGQGSAPGVWRYPARSTDGRGLADDLPEGAWLALPAGSVAKTTWPGWAKTIHKCLVEFGMFCCDQGGTLGISGVNPINGGVKWSDVGMGTGGSIGMPADFPWTSMRVLNPPAKP